MRFAISIPQNWGDGAFDPGAFADHLARAEEYGFDSAWTMESVLGRRPMLAPLETMAYAAAVTGRIRLGCAVFVTPLHGPVHLAKSLASLDQLSAGRVEVGVGTGGRRRPFAAFGVDPTGLVSRFTEGVELMKACWTEESVTFDGRFWQLQEAAMEPKPRQKPYPPLWFGGSHPNALRRAVAHGTGFMGAGSTTTAAFADQVRTLRVALAEAGRDPAGFRVAKRVYLAVDDDPAAAKSTVSAALAEQYGSAGPGDQVAVYGTPDDVAAGLRAVADAGAEMLLLNPMADDPAQLDRLISDVLPQL
jgi:probable F420-dependent oxidoreductase